MILLDDLALKYGTDKGPQSHNYMRYYDQHIGDPSAYRAVCELGVYAGASVRMWRDYCRRAQIVGVDSDRGHVLRYFPTDEERITLIFGSQSDPVTLAAVAERGPFDMIVDDAGHDDREIEASIAYLASHLVPGGLYVVEDLEESSGALANARALVDGHGGPWAEHFTLAWLYPSFHPRRFIVFMRR